VPSEKERLIPVLSAPQQKAKLTESQRKKALTKHRSIDLVSYQNNRECSTTIAGKARIAPVSIPPRA